MSERVSVPSNLCVKGSWGECDLHSDLPLPRVGGQSGDHTCVCSRGKDEPSGYIVFHCVVTVRYTCFNCLRHCATRVNFDETHQAKWQCVETLSQIAVMPPMADRGVAGCPRMIATFGRLLSRQPRVQIASVRVLFNSKQNVQLTACRLCF